MRKEDFVKVTNNWDTHSPLLWAALEATKHFKLPVLELGAGEGSTPALTQYCKDNGLELCSYDFNKEYAEKYNAIYVTDWDKIAWTKEYGCALVDESPGEQRKISLTKLHHVKIVCAHDTEPAADHGYKMRAELKKYKYMLDYETEGAWCSLVSNFIDVTKLSV